MYRERFGRDLLCYDQVLLDGTEVTLLTDSRKRFEGEFYTTISENMDGMRILNPANIRTSHIAMNRLYRSYRKGQESANALMCSLDDAMRSEVLHRIRTLNIVSLNDPVTHIAAMLGNTPPPLETVYDVFCHMAMLPDQADPRSVPYPFPCKNFRWALRMWNPYYQEHMEGRYLSDIELEGHIKHMAYMWVPELWAIHCLDILDKNSYTLITDADQVSKNFLSKRVAMVLSSPDPHVIADYYEAQGYSLRNHETV